MGQSARALPPPSTSPAASSDTKFGAGGQQQHQAGDRPRRIGVFTWDDAAAANTGVTWGEECWTAAQQSRAVLAAQTERLAAVLERNGIPARQETKTAVLGAVTGQVVPLEAWRPIRFLPLVAQRERRPMLNALKMYQRQPAATALRYAVVTAGDRVPLFGDLSGRLREHTRAISRWAHEADKYWNVEVLHRSTETPTNAPGKRDPVTAELLQEGVHVHSNLVYRPRQVMSRQRWSEFLAWSHQRLGAHWKDCGVIADMAEIVKYVVKPTDLDDCSDEIIVWLHNELFRKKLCQPMGAFKEWLAQLEDDGLKVAMVRVGKTSTLRLVEKLRREDRIESDDLTPGAKVAENVLLVRTLPVARFTPYAEPLFLVRNFNPEPQTGIGRIRLAAIEKLRALSRRDWDANGAPEPGSLIVHTASPIVQNLDPARPPPDPDEGSSGGGSGPQARSGPPVWDWETVFDVDFELDSDAAWPLMRQAAG